MFLPFKKEDDLGPDDSEKCELLYNKQSEYNNTLKIENVRSILLKHLQAVEDGTEKAEEMIISNIGDTIDSALEQENDDCEEIGVTDHPDFIFKDPSDLNVTVTEVKKYKAIDLCDKETLDRMSINLDEDQRIVLEIGVDYANSIVKARKVKIARTTPPLLIVQGGAGTGKSTVIDVLSQQMEKILRTTGDNPDHPYIIKAAFTGTAAANIKGQTMHNAFSFSFGNEFFSLGDKARDERRNLLENLKVVIIDEYSMIKSDMLYQLDLRLREIKNQPDLFFGGVSVFLFGDILQLRPVSAYYMFEKPSSSTFLLVFLIKSLWNQFGVVILRHNHRQGKDKQYADILNRVRIGEFTEQDVKALETRVRPLNHPDIPRDALVVTCRNVEVNEINENRLVAINEKLHIVEARNKSSTQSQFTPRCDTAGSICGTPLQKQLKLKVGAKVMLTYNIDTCDSLTNGAFGEVLGYEYNQGGHIKKVFVHFYDPDCGKERRKSFVLIQGKFPGKNVTPIDLIEFQYSRKKGSRNSNFTAIQFPLKLAFAATAHKVQGQTIKKPNSLVIDLRNVREAAQAYVVLSRVQALSQLFILVSVCADKIRASAIAMDELERMNQVSRGNKQISHNSVISCNIRSIKKNFENFKTASATKYALVMCLQETWLDPLIAECNLFEIQNWKQHTNSVGRGKGIATFYRNSFVWDIDVTEERYQMTKITSSSLDIINVYRSAGANDTEFLEDLCGLASSGNQTLIVGDFNICFLSDTSSPVFKELRNIGFKQIVKNPTHMEGRLIDLVFFRSQDTGIAYEVKQQAQYYTDHDLIEIVKGKLVS